jgi:hypothetical protein
VALAGDGNTTGGRGETISQDERLLNRENEVAGNLKRELGLERDRVLPARGILRDAAVWRRIG